MKQSEKSKITYDKILKAAIKEFGIKSYDNASLNNICNENNISKGLIYHNFKNKDELYLCCVKQCFDEIISFLNTVEYSNMNFSDNANKLLDLRYQLFSENQYYSNIFFGTILQPPRHLIKQIKEIKKEFDDFNRNQYEIIIKNVELREEITEDQALRYFEAFQDMFNSYFGSKSYENSDGDSLMKNHEIKLSKILNIVLYGIAKER